MTLHYGVFKDMMPQIGLTGAFASAASGLCSNWVAQFVTYPGEVVRTRMIVDGMGGGARQYNGMLDVAAKAFAREGVKAFWKGFIANAVRAIPASALQFAIYDGTRDFWLNKLTPK